MEAHAEFMFTRPVQINPQLYAMMEAHVLQHIAIMAAEQIEQQMMQETQKFQQQMQAMEQMPPMAQSATGLSETDTQNANALTDLLGTGQSVV